MQGDLLITGGIDCPHGHAKTQDTRAKGNAKDHDSQHGLHQRETRPPRLTSFRIIVSPVSMRHLSIP